MIPQKVDSANAYKIVTAFDSPGRALLQLLASLAVLFSTPFWLSPLLGMTILQGVFFLGIYYILSVVVGQVMKLRALSLVARENAKLIAKLTRQSEDQS